ncbi:MULTISPECIES: ANTAR domain-containing protein [Actinomycetes]|uniref:ANTAR domain-containing protein n=1 Tax=Actinomycetes TaxID=1760 RepID=UPI0005258572|nr:MULTISPECIES: ANTAR domain-containing protein [Actinomycetes]
MTPSRFLNYCGAPGVPSPPPSTPQPSPPQPAPAPVIAKHWEHYLTTTGDPTELPARYPDSYSRENIYVAAGMIAQQLALPADDALARLRAVSYHQTRPITEVADDVIARRLTLPIDPT